MKPLALLITIIIAFIANFQVLADSPLTSTDFSMAYQDEPVVVKASRTNGRLTAALINYLMSENNPIDVKMAAINALGWSLEGQTNSVKFLVGYLNQPNYLLGKTHTVN